MFRKLFTSAAYLFGEPISNKLPMRKRFLQVRYLNKQNKVENWTVLFNSLFMEAVNDLANITFTGC